MIEASDDATWDKKKRMRPQTGSGARRATPTDTQARSAGFAMSLFSVSLAQPRSQMPMFWANYLHCNLAKVHAALFATSLAIECPLCAECLKGPASPPCALCRPPKDYYFPQPVATLLADFRTPQMSTLSMLMLDGPFWTPQKKSCYIQSADKRPIYYPNFTTTAQTGKLSPGLFRLLIPWRINSPTIHFLSRTSTLSYRWNRMTRATRKPLLKLFLLKEVPLLFQLVATGRDGDKPLLHFRPVMDRGIATSLNS